MLNKAKENKKSTTKNTPTSSSKKEVCPRTLTQMLFAILKKKVKASWHHSKADE